MNYSVKFSSNNNKVLRYNGLHRIKWMPLGGSSLGGEMERERYQRMVTGMGITQIYVDEAIESPPPAPPAPEETKAAFIKLLAGSGVRKKLTVIENATHEMELGELDAYKEEFEEDKPKRLCPICHDPICPYSD